MFMAQKYINNLQNSLLNDLSVYQIQFSKNIAIARHRNTSMILYLSQCT